MKKIKRLFIKPLVVGFLTGTCPDNTNVILGIEEIEALRKAKKISKKNTWIDIRKKFYLLPHVFLGIVSEKGWQPASQFTPEILYQLEQCFAEDESRWRKGICRQCGLYLSMPSGTCQTCLYCGETSGCS